MFHSWLSNLTLKYGAVEQARSAETEVQAAKRRHNLLVIFYNHWTLFTSASPSQLAAPVVDTLIGVSDAFAAIKILMTLLADTLLKGTANHGLFGLTGSASDTPSS